VSHIVYVQYDRLVQKEYDISSNSESIKVWLVMFLIWPIQLV
jgi:hypothetical protein